MNYQEIESFRSPEQERLEVLQNFEILDTPPDGNFDKITELASLVFEVQVSFVGIIDQNRIWFKSKKGVDLNEIDRESALWAALSVENGIFCTEDASKDQRLSGCELLNECGIRFLGVVPVTTSEGYVLGVLGVGSTDHRIFSDSNQRVLKHLGEIVTAQIELQREARTARRHHHQILNTAAHDLKNPVSIMPLLADLIMKNKTNPAAIDDISKQIKKAGKNMSRTITDLLESAMKDSESMHLRLERINLTRLVKAVVNVNKAHATKKEQELLFSGAEDLEVFGDHVKLTQVVDNLINNAIKYSYKNNKIGIFLYAADNKAVFEVKDEGQGLSLDDQKNLFRRFTSLSSKPTGGEVSTGFGLYLSLEIIKAHGGEIYGSSEGKGKGSIFSFRLPIPEE